MSVFIRRAFSFFGGLLRLNVSKSGFGVSAGVKGLRIGEKSNARAYVTGGREGLYFRESLGGGTANAEGSETLSPESSATEPEEEWNPLRAVRSLSILAASDDAAGEKARASLAKIADGESPEVRAWIAEQVAIGAREHAERLAKIDPVREELYERRVVWERDAPARLAREIAERKAKLAAFAEKKAGGTADSGPGYRGGRK
jgi:hypothetical protein